MTMRRCTENNDSLCVGGDRIGCMHVCMILKATQVICKVTWISPSTDVKVTSSSKWLGEVENNRIRRIESLSRTLIFDTVKCDQWDC